ncbi:MAG: energy transducer TonB [Candidatus Zixiibacteriota bacterium]
MAFQYAGLVRFLAGFILLGGFFSAQGLAAAQDKSFDPRPASEPKIFKKLRAADSSEFTRSRYTSYTLDSAKAATAGNRFQFVWLNVQFNKDLTLKKSKVAYCSDPDKGLEQLARDVVKYQKVVPVPKKWVSIWSNDSEETVEGKWYWHRIDFYPTEKTLLGEVYGHEPRNVPAKLYGLAGSQCTVPAQSVIHPDYFHDSVVIGRSTEIWFKVAFANDSIVQMDPVYCYQCDSDEVALARDSLREMKLRRPDGSSPNAGWYYHRILILAEGDRFTPIEDGVPTPLDTTFLPYEMELNFLPEMVYLYRPEYPPDAKRNGQVGTVWVKMLVGDEGRVLLAKVQKSSGSSSLDSAAVAASERDLFKPAVLNEKPVPYWVTYPVVFKFKE